MTGGTGLIPGQGTKILRAARCGQKEKKSHGCIFEGRLLEDPIRIPSWGLEEFCLRCKAGAWIYRPAPFCSNDEYIWSSGGALEMSHSVNDISTGSFVPDCKGCQGRHEFSQTRLDLQALDCFVLGAFSCSTREHCVGGFPHGNLRISRPGLSAHPLSWALGTGFEQCLCASGLTI